MSKTLYLLRHAKSDWSEPNQRDFDRGLNPRGHRDAPRIGRHLHEAGVTLDLMVASTAYRTRLTAEYIAEQLRYDPDAIRFEERIYEAPTRVLLEVVNELPGDAQTVMIIGHNPSFTYLAEYLTGAEIGNVPTTGTVKIEFESDHWGEVSQRTGGFRWLKTPKNIEED